MNHESKKELSFAFFGTDEFSTAVLTELKTAGFLPTLIVTMPDRQRGRGLMLTPPPSKLWAETNKIECLQPEKLESILNLQLITYNLQLFVVASYGFIIPKTILDIPKMGALNVHPSLLPKYRGATPIESQILADEKEMGVTIIVMDEKMDHGPIVSAKRLERTKHNAPARLRMDDLPASLCEARRAGVQAGGQNPNKTQSTNIPKASELKKILAREGGKLLAQILPKWIEEKIKPEPQDHSQATYTKKLAKADGELNLAGDPYKNLLKIRAFDGSIGTYFFTTSSSSPFQGEEPSLLAPASFAPQNLLGRGRGVKKIRVIIKDAKLKNGKLTITRVIPEGKKEMSYEEFLRGLRRV